MSWIVEYQDRNGILTRSAVFGSEGPAQNYARTVRCGKVLQSAVCAPCVTPQRFPDGDTVDATRVEELEALVGPVTDHIRALRGRRYISDKMLIIQALSLAREQRRKAG
jgi:hypothetical protein